jgi:hypothetical protein
MHEPAAWGARPAQQSNVQIPEAANVSSGATLANNTANNSVASAVLAIRVTRTWFVRLNIVEPIGSAHFSTASAPDLTTLYN